VGWGATRISGGRYCGPAMPFARLVPELLCSDVERSRRFYVDLLGFAVRYARPEERFVYLEREGAEIMLEQPTGRTFLAAELQHPYGRGVNFQIEVSDVAALYTAVRAAAWPVFLALEDRWYRQDDVLVGNRQFIVQDPDGYLLRFFQDLGQRHRQTGSAQGREVGQDQSYQREGQRPFGHATSVGLGT
jgi:catechol 2,3-dioxygenase-like lactoylglutathione lyase family enzyme